MPCTIHFKTMRISLKETRYNDLTAKTNSPREGAVIMSKTEESF